MLLYVNAIYARLYYANYSIKLNKILIFLFQSFNIDSYINAIACSQTKFF